LLGNRLATFWRGPNARLSIETRCSRLGGLAAVACLDVSLDRLGRNLGAGGDTIQPVSSVFGTGPPTS
jgi:hypothetical protein